MNSARFKSPRSKNGPYRSRPRAYSLNNAKSHVSRPRIAVFSGPTATVQNTVPLITSNKARAKYGLPQLKNPDGTTQRFDALRAQYLAAPVTVYVRQFSAHPLERDTAELYAPPDGYVNAHGQFSREHSAAFNEPVYEVTLKPDDGAYLLPYMARQRNGKAWEDDTTHAGANRSDGHLGRDHLRGLALANDHPEQGRLTQHPENAASTQGYERRGPRQGRTGPPTFPERVRQEVRQKNGFC